MCLRTIDRETNKDAKIGYKVFEKIGLHYYGAYFGGPYFIGRRYSKSYYPTSILAETGGAYESGFHVFVNLEDAKNDRKFKFNSNFAIVKVAIENILESGQQFISPAVAHANVVVVETITLLEEVCV